MAEPQYLFAEIPLSRSAFDRWLKSSPYPLSHWPEWADIAINDEEAAGSVSEALMPFFITDPELQQCLLLHDKQQGVLRCALWLRDQEMRSCIMRMMALLRSTSPFMTAKAQGLVQHGENGCGTLTLTRNDTRWFPECQNLAFPEWSKQWLSHLGEANDAQWIDAKLFNALKRRYNHYLLNASAERPIAIKKTEYYSNGREVIDYYGNRIEGANPLTFRRLCHTCFDTLYTDDRGVWIDSDILKLYRHKIADNLTPERIQVLEEGYDSDFLLRIDNQLWFRAQDKVPQPFELRSLTIDPATFRRLTTHEYADKNALYRYTGNPGLRVIEDIAPQDIVRTVGEFVITENAVFYFGDVLPLARGKHFRSLGYDFYCDDSHVWLRNTLLEKLVPQTFRFVAPEHHLVADAQHVYLVTQYIADADPQTMEVLSRGTFLFWRDKKCIWYHDKKLEGADVTQGEIKLFPESVFCQIGDRIWGMTTELKDVDVGSFVVTRWDYAEDKHGRFHRDGRLNDANFNHCG